MKKFSTILLLLLIISSCKRELPPQSLADTSNGKGGSNIDSNKVMDTLFVGGSFTFAGSQLVNNIAKWDGSNWYPLGAGVKGRNVDVECLAFYKGELYAGGFIDSAGDKPVRNIAKWNGKTWSEVGNGIDGRVTSLVVYKDELYAGGWFFNAGGFKADNIAKWNGISWSSVGEGLSVKFILWLYLMEDFMPVDGFTITYLVTLTQKI